MELNPQPGHVVCEIDKHQALVTFNNPKRHNAMSVLMWSQLSEVMASIAVNDDIRVVVFQGAGEKAFVSGADISEFDEQRSSAEQVAEYAEVCEAADRAVSECPKPTIAKIRGYCIGGGLGLALACDMRICSDDAVFNMPAGKLGLGYSYRDSTRMLRMLGQAKASELFFTARRFNSTEALQIGFVNKTATPANLDSLVSEWVDAISQNAPLTMAAFKSCATNWARQDEACETDAVREAIDRCYSSSDYEEARRSFAEKRVPIFRGK